jgi:outer membrane protein TolC
VAQANHQFVAAQPGVFLSAEVLRMRRVALREGTSTALEVMDAQTNQLKVMAERAQIAHDYVLALASLLESCGLSEQFGAYISRADTTVR